MATEFERIKRAVETERDNYTKSNSRIESLKEEEQRILSSVSEQTGKEVTSYADAQKLMEEYRKSIEENIGKVKTILDEEGVTY